MAKEVKNGHEYYQGTLVEGFVGRIAKPFQLEESVGVSIADGDLVSFLVVTRADGDSFRSMKETGNKKKLMTFVSQDVIPLDFDTLLFIANQLKLSLSGVNDGPREYGNLPTLFDDMEEEDLGAFDVETGEVLVEEFV